MGIFSNRVIFVSFAASALLNIILWILLLGKFGFSSLPAPLHFNAVYGITLVGDSRLVYQLPLAGLIILLINLWIARGFFEREILFSYFSALTAAVIQMFLLIQAAALLALNS